ncbi:ABC transporter ATP-binding protein [Pengzhenrongella frigida]|uniref:ATP-binding cassette domain-containing protein n=1 Tax=Pengzhenrongella frigida TaxID=1259133 RepID=A0A4Q5MZM0_9MICO|nr:ATP-binding cassette domain-containing protein [Cellulomonas sp. HLT2-17]RYV49677.1 ATP-binding cassette domain-containing protein [Cellulomonas sp. HLT2-17]
MTSTEPLLRVAGVTHRLGPTGAPPVLHDIDLAVDAAELVALAGRSGSGKSTLCHLIAGLGRPTSGAVRVLGRPADEVASWATVALLPQRLALVEELSVRENVILPAGLHASTGPARSERRELCDLLLDTLNLTHLGARLASQTSLGEQQRTALARALVLQPRLAVLDEPTGHQDDENVDRVLAAILLARAGGTAIVVASHDERVLEAANRVVPLRDGRLVPAG